MRYFLWVHRSNGRNNSMVNGNYWLKSETFPSNKFMKDEIEKDENILPGTTVIVNIIEFKSEQDFNDFIS